jgi:hypothetical protein
LTIVHRITNETYMTRPNVGVTIAIAVAALAIGAVFGQPGIGPGRRDQARERSGPEDLGNRAQEGKTLTASKGSRADSPTSYA